MSRQLASLSATVIDGGYCIGCGLCASVKGSPIKMSLDDYGQFQAQIIPDELNASITNSINAVCPFSEAAIDEDRLGKELFSKDCQHHSKIGYYLATYAGYVTEAGFRDRGSSGGMGTWIVSTLFRQNLIDGVVHVHPHHPTAEDSRLFKYQISNTLEAIHQGAKSRYYPVELSEVLELVRNRPGRYALVGIPCFIKAVRLLTKQDAIIAERIKFFVGLVCGHLKSTNFAEMLAWQCGIEPSNLQAIDFRKKLPDRDANRYGVELKSTVEAENSSKIRPVKELQGSDWGQGFLKYKACDYCDDVVAETADISVGDAWLPHYVRDSQGTNVIVVRNPQIQKIIEEGIEQKQLHLDSITASEVAQSQNSGFKHRREGLAYRLYLANQQNQWCPPKRIKASNKIPGKFRKIIEMRILLRKQSHLAFKNAKEKGNLNLFITTMQSLIEEYRRLYTRNLGEKIWGKSKKLVKSFLNLLS